jgi:hypothetical protein
LAGAAQELFSPCFSQGLLQEDLRQAKARAFARL